MRSPSRASRRPADRRRHRALPVVVAVAAIALTAACAAPGLGGAPATPSHAAPSDAAPVADATSAAGDAVRVGEFVTECPFSHRSPDDPIVAPHGEAHGTDPNQGPAHSHDFFGNTTTDEHSTTASLLASGSTTCDLSADLSSYWTPTLSRGDTVIEVEQFAAYYDTAPGTDPARVAPIPAGLVMIAGNDPRPDRPAGDHVGWVCGGTRVTSMTVPSCRFRAPLTLRVVFPDCWNGADLDSADHRSHVTYGTGGTCPASHPVAMVRLVLSVRYPVFGDPSDLRLASGPLSTAHADFMNAWTEQGQAELVDLCIRRRVVCGVV